MADFPINVETNISFEQKDYNSNGIDQRSPQLDLSLCTVSISQAKILIRTAIQGKDGAVTEYIGLDDYYVVIQGRFNGDNGIYPEDLVTQLKKVVTAPVALEVVSPFLQLWDINQLIINGYDIPQEEGGVSYQTFTITAFSNNEQSIFLS